LRFYGVIDADDADKRDFALDNVTLIIFRDLGAVVAPAPYERVPPNDVNIAEYVNVIDALSRKGPVIPAPPGAVFRDERVLMRWMEIHYAKLHEALGFIERREDAGAPYDIVRMDMGA
jgi:hypothetical protein